MQGRIEEFEQRGAAVLLITFARPELLPDFIDHLKLTYPVASDPEQAAYRSYGLLQASPSEIWHPKVIALYARLMLKGRNPLAHRRAATDLSQLGGDFVINGSGKVLYAFYSERSDLRPTVDELVAHCP